MLEFLAQNRRIDAELLRDLLRKFIAHNATGNPLNVRQQVVDGFNFAFAAAGGELGPGAFDQIVEVALRSAQSLSVGVFALAPDKEIGIKALSRVSTLT